MSFEARVTVRPDAGRFQPGSFRELLQRRVELPGLDRVWNHTLIDVQVAPDGNSAELTVHSEPVHALSLDRGLRVVQGVPPAHVRVHDEHGQVLIETRLAAPLHPGQQVEVGGITHQVVGVPTWPGRHPETGHCAGDLDWQHVTVRPNPRPVVAPTAVNNEQGAGS